MKLIQLNKNSNLLQHAILLHSSCSQKASTESATLLSAKLQDPTRELFLFQHNADYVGFAEVELESECFPDEDLPEICLKVHTFYIDPNKQGKGLGSAFFQLLKTWGHEQKASMIEMEVSSSDNSANAFLQHQGLELIGRGEQNGYRSFL